MKQKIFLLEKKKKDFIKFSIKLVKINQQFTLVSLISLINDTKTDQLMCKKILKVLTENGDGDNDFRALKNVIKNFAYAKL